MLSHFLLPWPNRSMRRRCSRLLEDILHWALKCEQKDWKVFEEANYWVTVPKKKKAMRILTKKKQLWERLFGETNLGEKDFLEFHSWDGGLEVSGTAIFIDPQGHWLNKLGTWDGKDPGIFWDKTQPINGWGTQVAWGLQRESVPLCIIKWLTAVKACTTIQRTHDTIFMGGPPLPWAQWGGITGPQTMFLVVPLITGKLKSKPVTSD